jgi:FkbM family methyltransferase
MSLSHSEFLPYIARDRRFRDFCFDFIIKNETGKSWYDGSPNQSMPEREWCADHIRPGFNILDCGAHHGMMAVLFSMLVGPGGKVTAYEALPSNADVITENVVINKLTNVLVRGVGVGAASKRVSISNNSTNTIVVNNKSGVDLQEIEIVALDSEFKAEERVDFIKIDVEGYELEALRGSIKLLEQRPIIDLELHNFMFSNRVAHVTAVMSIIKRFGYRFEVFPEIFDKPVDLGETFDATWLAQFDNPHVMCLPTEPIKPKWRRVLGL